MLDGIRLSSDQTAVVALGIDNKGNKQVVDFVLGSNENLEVSRELMGRIVKRGFQCEHRLYVVLDGSDAVRVAVRKFFPDAIVQRCLVHMERNIKGKLSSVTGVSYRGFSRVAVSPKGSQRRRGWNPRKACSSTC